MAGNGSLANPCQIINWTDLQAMNQNLSLNYKLMNNLEVTDPGYSTVNAGPNGFNPIGNNSVKFTGTFEGNNKTITGLYINRTTDNVGLFGFVSGTSAVIKNVGLINVNITGGENVGGLVGSINQGGSVVSNSYATGTVRGTGNWNVGGLVGYFSGDVIVRNSYAACSVTGKNGVGGLVGGADMSNFITDSYATGTVTGTGDYIGGLIGDLYSGIISNSYATGNVNGNSRVGGLAGNCKGTGIEISNSYATGKVNGTGNYVGGLIGQSPVDSISNSYWDVCRTGQNNCTGNSGTPSGCNQVNNATNPDNSYFYNLSNEPMLSWTYPPWAITCDTVGFAILAGLAGQECEQGPVCSFGGQQEAIPEVNSSSVVTIFVLLIAALLIGALLLRKK
jgi:hypothetical protein